MARENERETPNRPGRAGGQRSVDTTEASTDGDRTCPHCGSSSTCGGQPDCRDCGTAFSVRVRDEFVLVERNGWAVAVSVGPTDGQEAVDG